MKNGANPNGNEPSTDENVKIEEIAGHDVNVTYKDGEIVSVEEPALEGQALEDWQGKAQNVVNMKVSSHNKYEEANKIKRVNEVKTQELSEWEIKLKAKEAAINSKIAGGAGNQPSNFNGWLKEHNSDYDGITTAEDLLDDNPAKYHEAHDKYQESKFQARLDAMQAGNQASSVSNLISQQIINDSDISVAPSVVEAWANEREFPFNAYAVAAYKDAHKTRIDPTDQINKIEKKRKTNVLFVKHGTVASASHFKMLTQNEISLLSAEALDAYEKQLDAIVAK